MPEAIPIRRGIRQRRFDVAAANAFKADLRAVAQRHAGADALLPGFLHEVDRETTASERRQFIMMRGDMLARAMTQVCEHSRRPQTSIRVLAAVIEAAQASGDGFVDVSPDELARRAGVGRQNLSTALNEMARLNIVKRFTSGRTVVWQLCAAVGHQLPGEAGIQAAKAAGEVLRFPVRGERIDDPRQGDLEAAIRRDLAAIRDGTPHG